MSIPEEKQTIENEYAIISAENGILVGVYKPIVIDIDGAKVVVKDRKKASDNELMPILVDGRKVKEITKEARDYFGSKEGSELLSAAAILVDSTLTTFLANFVLKISFRKQNIPMQVFNDRKKAINWLKQYR